MSPDIFYVQVEDKETGEQYPIPVDRFDSSLFKRLDESPIHPQTGMELPSKPKTSVAREASKKADTPSSGQKAVTQKENN